MKDINIHKNVDSSGLANNSWLAKSIVLGLFGLTLTACGGGSSSSGGDSSSPTRTAITPPVASANADGTITFSWVNPNNVTVINITRTTYEDAETEEFVERGVDIRIGNNEDITKPGRIITTLEAIDIADITDGQYHEFSITPTALPNATAALDEAEALDPINSTRIQVNFPKITDLEIDMESLSFEVGVGTTYSLSLSWTNPARVASIAVMAHRYDDLDTDFTSGLVNILPSTSFTTVPATVDDPDLIMEGAVEFNISGRFADGNYSFSVTPTFASINDAKTGTAITTDGFVEIFGGGNPPPPDGSTQATPTLATAVTNDPNSGGVNVTVTATKQDALGNSISFPLVVNSTANVCSANLNTTGATIDGDNANLAYPATDQGSTVAVTYTVAYPDADIVCGDFSFNATEDGKTGEATYSGLTFLDVDDDNDGLIEISSAAELNMTRNNLAGTGLDFNNADGDNTTGGNSLGCPVGGCFGYELAADIDLSDLGVGSSWTPIGTVDAPFAAMFNGNGYNINNLTIDANTANPALPANGVGLFGLTNSAAELRNVHLEVITINAIVINEDGNAISGSNNVGALVGLAEGTRILFSSVIISPPVTDNALLAGANVGGLVGSAIGAVISASSVFVEEGSIDGRNAGSMGGLIGVATDTTINSSYANVVALFDTNSLYLFLGGLVGNATGATIGTSLAITRNNIVSTSSSVSRGGFVGGGVPTAIGDSYWDNSTEFSLAQADNSLGTGYDTAALQIADTSGIYSRWARAWCDPATGLYGEAVDLPAGPDVRRAWVFEDDAYPTLNCRPARPTN